VASVRSRTNKDGSQTHAVLYRIGGKQTSKTFATRKDAENFKTLCNLLGPDKALTTLAAPVVGLTVDELAERFFEWKADSVTPRTLADYRRDYANWIQPALGHRAADTIDERDVQALVDKMAKTLDPKSVKDRHMILGGMYRYGSAKSRRIVDHNPCLETELPKRKKKAVKGATIPEWLAVYEAAQRVAPDAADVLLFLVTTGWRWSEATPLTVGAFEDYGDEMFVSVQRVMRRDGELKFVVAEDEAKSFAGIRRIRIGQLTAQMIRRRVIGKGPGDLVFTNRFGRRWHQTNFLNRTWTDILEAAGITRRFTPHALRHTHVALLDRSGASLPEMQRRLGHEDVRTTIGTYGGMIDGVSGQTLDALDALLTPHVSIEGTVIKGELA
jgi:integrase